MKLVGWNDGDGDGDLNFHEAEVEEDEECDLEDVREGVPALASVTVDRLALSPYLNDVEETTYRMMERDYDALVGYLRENLQR